MAKVVAVTETIKSLADVETRLGLRPTEDVNFFREWLDPLPALSQVEQEALSVIRRRLLYHRADGDLLEGTVTLLVTSPLLALAGFYDPPFKVKAEAAVELAIADGEEILRGRIDVLVLHQRFWVLVIESKKTTISTRSALPQALTYMMAKAENEQPLYGLLTNGDDIVFVKLVTQPVAQYSLSRAFSLYTVPSELTAVLQVLKQMGQIMQAQ